MDSPAYHALVLAGCATFWYLTYRTLRPLQLHSAGISQGRRGQGGHGINSNDGIGASYSAAAAAAAAAATAGEVEGGEQTVASADTFKVALLSVPRDAIGAIIGKDGAVIRQLQQATKTRITFADRAPTAGADGAPADEKPSSTAAPATETVRIRGEARCVHAAEEELRRIIATVPRKETSEFRLACRYIGPLIGKGGQQVRSLMSQSRCRIDIERSSNGNSRSSEETRQVTLRGTRDQIDLAMTLIDQLCAEIDQREGRRSAAGANDRPVSVNNGAANGAYSASKASTASTSSSSSQQPLPPPPLQQPPPPLQQPPPPLQQQPALFQFATFPTNATNEPVSVCVSAVGDDPLLYYVLCDNEHSRSLSNLVCSMVDFYSGMGPDHPLGRDLRPGELVAAYYEQENTWQRARVVSVEADEQAGGGGGMLDVDCVDYGDSLVVPMGRAFRLQPQFCELPFQAIRCTLDAEIVLPAGRSDECIAEFQRLTKCASYEPIRARLIRFRPDNGEPVLQLLSPVDNWEVCVTEELRRQGFLA